jgi:hypothetical protein
MRTDKELIQLVLDNFYEYFVTGLCTMLSNLHYNYLISEEEYDQLLLLFEQNKPKKAGKFGLYWWLCCYKKPRILFLKKILNQVSLETIK